MRNSQQHSNEFDSDLVCPLRLDQLPSQSALPDALQGAAELEGEARRLDKNLLQQASELRSQARQIVSKELNELDGFDR